MDRGIYDCNIQPPNSVLSGIKKFNVTSKYNNYCNNNYDSPSKYTKLSLYYTCFINLIGHEFHHPC